MLRGTTVGVRDGLAAVIPSGGPRPRRWDGGAHNPRGVAEVVVSAGAADRRPCGAGVLLEVFAEFDRSAVCARADGGRGAAEQCERLGPDRVAVASTRSAARTQMGTWWDHKVPERRGPTVLGHA